MGKKKGRKIETKRKEKKGWSFGSKKRKAVQRLLVDEEEKQSF